MEIDESNTFSKAQKIAQGFKARERTTSRQRTVVAGESKGGSSTDIVSFPNVSSIDKSVREAQARK
jgi:hypothetical protein